MVHSRETRAAAAEIKFLIDPAVAPAVRAWARAHLQADPHGSGPSGDEYETASLYYDTPDLDVLHRRQSYGRAKYRVRRYGNADTIFLERKLRKPGLLIKRRTVESLSALDRLESNGHDAGWAGEWFHRRLIVRRLRPVSQVVYHRVARVLDCPEGPARLTLDSHLRAMAATDARFSLEPGTPFLEDRLVLELKYRERLPAVFRRLVEEFALRAETASKYRLGMAALGHVAAGGEPVVASGTGLSYA
jgi:hypothetical protein